MNKLVYAVAAVACLTAAPALITPAVAQVSIGIGDDRPGIRVGREEERGMRRGEDRARYNGERNQGECREVTVQTRRIDGPMTTSKTRRCD
jgi:hypothetical protein